MTDRRAQRRELYGLDFSDELSAFHDWHGTLAGDAKPYSMKVTFKVGDVMTHPTFGVGTVRTVLPERRIEVAFVGGARTLAHGRP